MFHAFFSELKTMSSEGGWVLWSLIALAFGIAFALISIFYLLRFPNPPYLRSTEWRKLLHAKKHLPATLLQRLAQGFPKHPRDRVLSEIEHSLFATLSRRLPFAFVLIGAAPLVGLLGTVSGMFTTFRGLAHSSATAPIDVISRGISEALVTTQAGLIIAVPSFIVCLLLNSYFEHLRSGFQRVRSALVQSELEAAANFMP